MSAQDASLPPSDSTGANQTEEAITLDIRDAVKTLLARHGLLQELQHDISTKVKDVLDGNAPSSAVDWETVDTTPYAPAAIELIANFLSNFGFSSTLREFQREVVEGPLRLVEKETSAKSEVEELLKYGEPWRIGQVLVPRCCDEIASIYRLPYLKDRNSRSGEGEITTGHGRTVRPLLIDCIAVAAEARRQQSGEEDGRSDNEERQQDATGTHRPDAQDAKASDDNVGGAGDQARQTQDASNLYPHDSIDYANDDDDSDVLASSEETSEDLVRRRSKTPP